MLSQFSGLKVIIYGIHCQSWCDATDPTAPVWERLPQVKQVAVAPEGALRPPRFNWRPTVVIPLMERHIERFPGGYPSLLPDGNSLETLRDKQRFAAYAKSHNLSGSIPETYADISQAKFPCVIKRVDLNNGNGVALLNSIADYKQRLQEEDWKGHSYILQEFVPGDTEHMTQCILNNGELLWSRSYYYSIPSGTIRNGDWVAEPCQIKSTVLRQLTDFLKPLKFTGPCNIDYRVTGDDRVVIFEINPRFAGTLMNPRRIADLQSSLYCVIKTALLNSGSRRHRSYAEKHFSTTDESNWLAATTQA